MVEDFLIKKGDRLPYYEAIIRSYQGAMDLSGTAVYFTMRNLSTLTNKVSMAVMNTMSGILGGVAYRWASADTDTPGEYGVELTVQGAGGKFTVPKGFTAKVIVEETYT
jgi:hypothetical protein